MSFDQQIQEFQSLINNDWITLIQCSKNIYDVIFYCKISNKNLNLYELQLTTDFDTFCYLNNVVKNINQENINQENINRSFNTHIKNFNIIIIFKKKTPSIIFEELYKTLLPQLSISNDQHNIKHIYNDPFYIDYKLDIFTKYPIDYIEFEKKLNAILLEKDKKSNKLFTMTQMNKLIVEEIRTINHNKLYNHYIIVNTNNPYIFIIRLKFNNNPIKKILDLIKTKYNYDYIELKITLNSDSYPSVPPKLDYIKPHITDELLMGLLDLNILKLENWNSTITLEYIILNIAQQFEIIGYKYILEEHELNKQDFAFNKLYYEIIKLLSITKNDVLHKILLKIDIPKFKDFNRIKKYWKEGTGYGTDDTTNLNSNIYLENQDNQKKEIISILKNIIEYIKDNSFEFNKDDNIKKLLLAFFKNQINGINLLEIVSNKEMYSHIFNMLEICNISTDNLFLITLGNYLSNLYEELDILIKNSQTYAHNIFLLHLHCIAEFYYNKFISSTQNYINSEENNLIDDDIKLEYCKIMKKLQFGIFELSDHHKFSNFKSNKPTQQAIIRILSEISSFKSSLPLNWESSIWVRIPKDNYNIFTFLISGPNNTPYENGLFEFHAHFPVDYPATVPQVLLYTTGGNTVRFNPNLYNTGKVCLSLLNTWSGHEEEKWNPKTSTFLQVMISIQSLIFVEEPYFNEPGWEKDMHTSKGKERSNIYNEDTYPHTIKLAMIDMLIHPPQGFEEIIKQHFKFKKNEIMNTITKWNKNAKNPWNKTEIEKYSTQLNLLIKDL